MAEGVLFFTTSSSGALGGAAEGRTLLVGAPGLRTEATGLSMMFVLGSRRMGMAAPMKLRLHGPGWVCGTCGGRGRTVGLVGDFAVPFGGQGVSSQAGNPTVEISSGSVG